MKKIMLTLLLVFVFQILSIGQQKIKINDGNKFLVPEDSLWLTTDSLRRYNVRSATITNLEIPAVDPNDIIITHAGYSLLYNETHEQANWVAYELTKEETKKVFERTDNFRTDPKVNTETANDIDYYKSGYDRGHLAPAADMGWSSEAITESFYYSNMSPQLPNFNRGV